jgi:hypothetical protein
MAKILRKKREKLNARRNAHGVTLKTLPSGVNPASYRQPGSMNRKKG